MITNQIYSMHSLAVSFELTFCVSTLRSKWLLKLLQMRSVVKCGNPSGLVTLKIKQDAKFVLIRVEILSTMYKKAIPRQ